MATILDQIVSGTREVVWARRRRMPPEALLDMPGWHRPPADLAGALRTDRLAVIAECKRASPSRGEIRPGYAAGAIARSYGAAGAEAVSVVTEPLHFLGSMEDLAAARTQVSVPILRKDFTVDRYQLLEARAYGADAVLLIASVLEGSRLNELHDEAAELGLSCLVECHDEEEVDRLDFDRVRVIGANNRDLRTFEVDTGRARRILAHVPPHVVCVAESGIASAADLADVRRAGIDAVLVGEAFLREPDPGRALAELRGRAERLLSDDLQTP